MIYFVQIPPSKSEGLFFLTPVYVGKIRPKKLFQTRRSNFNRFEQF